MDKFKEFIKHINSPLCNKQEWIRKIFNEIKKSKNENFKERSFNS